MKKNAVTFIILFLFVVYFCPSNAHAGRWSDFQSNTASYIKTGTWIVGAKGWVADWESSVLEWFEKEIAADFMELGVVLDADSDPGDGYLAGPLFSHQSKDGKWAVSFAPMVFSSFSQDWDGTAGQMGAIRSDVDLDRIDFDLALNYSLSKNFKLFVGYKHQIMDMDFTLSYNTMMAAETYEYELESTVMIPTVGVGYIHPVHEKVVLGVQLGVLYTISELDMKNSEGQTFDIWPHSSLGFNGEVNVNYQPIRDLVLQLGYRYQHFTLEARSPGRWNTTVSDDVTYGVTVSVLYVF